MANMTVKKRSALIFLLLFLAGAAEAKSFIVRSDGSVVTFDSGEEAKAIPTLKQNDVEEMPLPPKTEIQPFTKNYADSADKTPQKKRSDLVPLTQKEVEER